MVGYTEVVRAPTLDRVCDMLDPVKSWDVLSSYGAAIGLGLLVRCM